MHLSQLYVPASASLMISTIATPDGVGDVLVQHYGPIAFGLVAVLIIWARIVQPAMKEGKTDNTATLAALQSIATQVNASAVAISAAATELRIAIEAQRRLQEMTAEALRSENRHRPDTERKS